MNLYFRVIFCDLTFWFDFVQLLDHVFEVLRHDDISFVFRNQNQIPICVLVQNGFHVWERDFHIARLDIVVPFGLFDLEDVVDLRVASECSINQLDNMSQLVPVHFMAYSIISADDVVRDHDRFFMFAEKSCKWFRSGDFLELFLVQLENQF